MEINWPIIAGVFIAGGILGGGMITAMLQMLLQHPKKRTNIANAYTDTHVKRLQEDWVIEYQKLHKSYNAMTRKCEKRDRELSETQKKLNETRAALTILNSAANQSIPILRGMSKDDTRIDKLENALDTVRRIMERS